MANDLTLARFEALYYRVRDKVFTLQDVENANIKKTTFKKYFKEMGIKEVENGFQFIWKPKNKNKKINKKYLTNAFEYDKI